MDKLHSKKSYDSFDSSNNKHRTAKTARRYRQSMIEDSDERQSQVTRITQHLRNLKASRPSRSAKCRLPRKSRKSGHSGFVIRNTALQRKSYHSIKDSLSQKTSNYSSQIKKVLNILTENRKLLFEHKLCNRQHSRNSTKVIFNEELLGKKSSESQKHNKLSNKANNIWCNAPEASYEISGLPKLRDSKNLRHFQTYNIFYNKAYYPNRRKNIRGKRSYHQGEQKHSPSLGSQQNSRQVKSESELQRDSVSSQEVKNIKTCILNTREKNRSQIRKLKKSLSGLSKTCAGEAKVSFVESNAPSQSDKKKVIKSDLDLDFADSQISLQLDNVSKVNIISKSDMLKQKGNELSHNSIINKTQLPFPNQVHCTRILRYLLSFIIIIVWTPCLIVILLYGIMLQCFVHKDLKISHRKRSIKEWLEFISCKYFSATLRPLFLFLINGENERKLKKYPEYNSRSQSRKRIHSIFFFTDNQQSPKMKQAQSSPKFRRSPLEQKSENFKPEKNIKRFKSETLLHKRHSNTKANHIVTSDKKSNIAPLNIQNVQVTLQNNDKLQTNISKHSVNAVKNALLSDIYAPPELHNSKLSIVHNGNLKHQMEKRYSASHSRQFSQKQLYTHSSKAFIDKLNNDNKISRNDSRSGEINLNKSNKTSRDSKQHTNWTMKKRIENQQQTSERVLTTLPLAFKPSKSSCSCCSDVCAHRPGLQGGHFKLTICPKSPPTKSKEQIELERKIMLKKYKDCMTSCKSLLKGRNVTCDQELMTEIKNKFKLIGKCKLPNIPYKKIFTKVKCTVQGTLKKAYNATKEKLKEQLSTPDDEEEEEAAEEEEEEQKHKKHDVRKKHQEKHTQKRITKTKAKPKTDLGEDLEYYDVQYESVKYDSKKQEKKGVSGEDPKNVNEQYKSVEHDVKKQKNKDGKKDSGEDLKTNEVQNKKKENDVEKQKDIEHDKNKTESDLKKETDKTKEVLKHKEVGNTEGLKKPIKEPPTTHQKRIVTYKRENEEKKDISPTRAAAGRKKIRKVGQNRKRGKKQKKRRKRKTIRQRYIRFRKKLNRKIFKQWIPKCDKYLAKNLGPPVGKCQRMYFYTLAHKPKVCVYKYCPCCYPCCLRWSNLCRSFWRALIYCWCCIFWCPVALLMWLCNTLLCFIT